MGRPSRSRLRCGRVDRVVDDRHAVLGVSGLDHGRAGRAGRLGGPGEVDVQRGRQSAAELVLAGARSHVVDTLGDLGADQLSLTSVVETFWPDWQKNSSLVVAEAGSDQLKRV